MTEKSRNIERVKTTDQEENASLVIDSLAALNLRRYPKRFVSLFEGLKQKGCSLHVKINNNRQTILSVRWKERETRVSLHHMFLSAPENIMDALACYIQGNTKAIAPEIKAYIESQRTLLDYSKDVDRKSLETKGEWYDLLAIYKKINKEEFASSLDLSITWFGSSEPKNRSRCSLGLYYDTLKLIKIHKLLDTAKVPQFVVEFVVFHEMLHAACPAYIDEKGIYRMHGAEFKEREEQFYCYKEASEWIKKHEMYFFLRRGRTDGRP